VTAASSGDGWELFDVRGIRLRAVCALMPGIASNASRVGDEAELSAIAVASLPGARGRRRLAVEPVGEALRRQHVGRCVRFGPVDQGALSKRKVP